LDKLPAGEIHAVFPLSFNGLYQIGVDGELAIQRFGIARWILDILSRLKEPAEFAATLLILDGNRIDQSSFATVHRLAKSDAFQTTSL
jgi:hypothetical protein